MADGEREPVDTIIYATGFRPHLPYMKLLGALDEEGMPLQKAGTSTTPLKVADANDRWRRCQVCCKKVTSPFE
ncbi:hypothetical protein [Lysinibacillus sp. ZYM-1]|uniref:hypothetical protein n=1 Tax=Lysinibacillus sp. ZYM-1 TaxID=1681184 RepID=UPI000AB88E1F